jgi:hypothetical protein
MMTNGVAGAGADESGSSRDSGESGCAMAAQVTSTGVSQRARQRQRQTAPITNTCYLSKEADSAGDVQRNVVDKKQVLSAGRYDESK